jgi:hypothetical protein
MELATPAVLRAHLAAEVAKWGPVIKAAGARGEYGVPPKSETPIIGTVLQGED